MARDFRSVIQEISKSGRLVAPLPTPDLGQLPGGNVLDTPTPADRKCDGRGVDGTAYGRLGLLRAHLAIRHAGSWRRHAPWNVGKNSVPARARPLLKRLKRGVGAVRAADCGFDLSGP